MARLQPGISDLATVEPALAAQWHPTKNDALTSSDVAAGSRKKTWWLGACGHEWEATVADRSRGRGCAVCAGKRVLAGFNDLATVDPVLAAQWHPIRNGALRPTDVTIMSGKKTWWLGSCGHEWETTVDSRSRGRGCAVCAGKRVLAGFNDLATVNPALAAQWHPTKNDALTSSDVAAGSRKKTWWLGACGHEWEATINHRSSGVGCAVCAGKRVLAGLNDLATVDPVLAAQWHPTRNDALRPTDVTKGSHRKAWWFGVCGHEWEAQIGSRSSRKGRGCPVCSGSQVLAGFNDLATVNPTLAAQWHPTRNGGLTPSDVTAGSNRKVWWVGVCDHEWEVTVAGRSSGSGCAACAGKRVLAGFNDLATVNPALAAEWHPTKNGALTATDVAAQSNKKAWWLGGCGHEWEAAINNRSSRKGRGCPVCSGDQILAGFNDLASVNPTLAAEWHPTRNGGLRPTDVTRGSNRKVWWVGVCGHEWEAQIKSRSSGVGCAVCAGKRVLAGFNDLATTDPTLAAEWHPTRNGGLRPTDVKAGSGKKVWWIDGEGHEWVGTVDGRHRGHGCAVCAGKRVLAGLNDLATINPALAAQWHQTKNSGLRPTDVAASSHRKVWWAGVCGHEWEANPHARTSGQGCAVCVGRQIHVGVNDLATVDPALAAQWHPTKNGGLRPTDVTASSHRKVWWIGACGHEWETTVADRSSGRGCASCAVHGFGPAAPGRLYLLHHPVERLVKVGITTAANDTRLNNFAGRGWVVLDTITFNTGQEALDDERILLRHLRSVAAVDSTLAVRTARAAGLQCGVTEMFDESVTACRTLADLMAEAG